MKVLIVGLIVVLSFIVYVRLLEATSLFFPSREILATPKDKGLDYEEIYFVSRPAGRTPPWRDTGSQARIILHGWLVKASPGPELQTTLIFLHGNAGNISDRVEKIAAFHRLGLNVFIFDYRGYGKSQGRPTEQGMYEDAMAAFDYLMTREDIARDKIVGYGASLGGAAAVDLASRRKLAGLILDSTFTSAADMARRIVPFVPSFLLKIKLDSITKIQEVSVPKLFIHSPEDETVPFSLGRKLYESAPRPKEFLETSGSHNEGHVASQDIFLGGIKDFLKRQDLM